MLWAYSWKFDPSSRRQVFIFLYIERFRGLFLFCSAIYIIPYLYYYDSNWSKDYHIVIASEWKKTRSKKKFRDWQKRILIDAGTLLAIIIIITMNTILIIIIINRALLNDGTLQWEWIKLSEISRPISTLWARPLLLRYYIYVYTKCI